ncbi:hypothetical protein LOZ58_004424 [Ophidiomyces ophidiicola]|nr:hypothetical protein LOZ65_000339 [Ophidiomyces ophidiicola]KAI1959615.1 hypothetical protein LOZ58_004424 [Ophidiomyces ophidiicola]
MSLSRLVEPLPSAPTASRRQSLYSGRGSSASQTSALNTFTQPIVDHMASLKHLSSHRPKQMFSSGGIHTCSTSEIAIFSFDEELEYELRREKEAAPVFHVGRSGARSSFYQDNTRSNNTCNYNPTFSRKQSSTSSVGSSGNESTNLQKTSWTKTNSDSWRTSYRTNSS